MALPGWLPNRVQSAILTDYRNRPSEPPMLRFAVALLAVVVTCEAAEGADRALAPYRRHRTVGLPAGLPRPNYNFRTTITYAAPYIYRRPSPWLPVYEAPAVLYTPVVYDDFPYIAPLPVAPVIDPYVPYWDRLPYACGVYGYC
jgi:hypothetical protein